MYRLVNNFMAFFSGKESKTPKYGLLIEEKESDEMQEM